MKILLSLLGSLYIISAATAAEKAHDHQTMPRSAVGKEMTHVLGQELLKPFQQALQQALQQGMQQGVLEAVDTCQVQAPEIAKQAAEAEGVVRVGRASAKLRNPANVAPAWVQPVLEHYTAHPNHAQPQWLDIAPEQRTNKATKGFVAPIQVGAMCLSCHGSQLSPQLDAHIRKRYPDDKARGYEVGDFRGLFWIEVQ